MKKYLVKDWDAHFENNRTREMAVMRWVPVPNKHDGEGFATIMDHPDGLKLFGAWNLILQVASKCKPRGELVKEDGTPHTPRSIALKTRCRNPEDIAAALEFFASPDVGWLVAVPLEGCDIPAPARGNPAPARVEGKGMEGNGRKEGSEAPRAPTQWTPLPDKHTDKEALDFAKASHSALSKVSEMHLSAMVHKYAADPAKRAKALNDFATHFSGDAPFQRGTAMSTLEAYFRREFNWPEENGTGKGKDGSKPRREAWQIQKDVEVIRSEMTAMHNRCRFDYDGKTKFPEEWKQYLELKARAAALEKEAVKAAQAAATG